MKKQLVEEQNFSQEIMRFDFNVYGDRINQTF